MWAFAVNAGVVVIGSLIGLFFRRIIKKDICDSVLKAMGIVVLLIGIDGVLKNLVFVTDAGKEKDYTLLLIMSVAIGTFIGEFLKIDDHMNNFANAIEKKINRGKIAEGFITATLIYCVGSMAITGSIESAVNNNPDTIYLKAALDGVTSIALASTLGIGVLLSSVSILLYQGLLTLLFWLLGGFMPQELIQMLSMTGFALVAAIGLNFLVKDKIKVANMLPALAVVALYYVVNSWF